MPTVRRLSLIIALSLCGTLGVGIFADSLVAARTEAKISQKIYENSNLAVPPDVILTGLPYTAAALSGELPSITVHAQDVDVPQLGLMSIYNSAQAVEVSSEDIFHGTFRDQPAEIFFTRLQLDGVLLGSRLGIPDLQIQNKDDISPLGGWETEAVLEGTPAGFSDPVTVSVTLRLHDGQVVITPMEITKAPEDPLPKPVRQRIINAFSLTFHKDELPLKSAASRIFVTGGSIFVEAELYNTRISLQDFAPYSRPLSEEEQPSL